MLQMRVIAKGTAVVRNRMPGGVGGRREQSRLLPDTFKPPSMKVVIVYSRLCLNSAHARY